MSKDKETEAFEDFKPEKKEKKKISIKEWFDGSIITRDTFVKQLPYIFFVSFLGILYIGNRYHAEKVVRDLDKIKQEVEDLRAESITTASELMMISKQSEVVKLIKEENLDLEESVTPPIKIEEY